jgi:hypothetical protein
MTNQHTPGPLNVKRGQFGSSVFVIYGADDFPIAQTISNGSPEGMERARRGEHEANAKRLVQCWNSHDSLHADRATLLTVARDCEAALDQYSTLPADKAKALLKALRAAIAKATGSAA